MRHLLSIILPSFILAACAMPQNALNQLPSGPQQMDQVTWRENTPVAARVADNRSCEAQALGVSPFATDQEIMAAIGSISEAERDSRRDSCMVGRGYTITLKPVCNGADSQGREIQIGRNIDFLPPLSAIKCFVPSQGGFVMV